MNLIEQGITKGLIRFDEEKNFITYIHQNTKRSYNNPEEKVQAEAFLSLVLIYGYPVNRIKNYVSVQVGAKTLEADIIVYNDDDHESTFVVVECKKDAITDQEFKVAVDQAYSYAVAEGGKFVWTTSRIKNAYYEVPDKKPKSRTVISDIPHFGKELQPFKYVKGGIKVIAEEGKIEYGRGKEEKYFDLKKVDEKELTRIFSQAHQALWGGGQRNPSMAFDELDKLIFCKIWDERHPRKNGEPYQFQIFTGEKPDELLQRIRDIYEEGRKKDPEVFKEGINLSPEETQTIVEYLQEVNLNKTDLDSKGKAFETFMGGFFRGEFGQYFTPRTIVKFIVDCLPIDNTKRVLDTSCGSGGFLLYALDKVREQASEFYDPVKEEKDHFRHWHDFAEKNLYGIEINEQIARTAKMNMIIHDDGHTNVIAADGLLSADYKKSKAGETKDEIEIREMHNRNTIQGKSGNHSFQFNSFDFIITNPPFGSSVKQNEKAYLALYNLGTKEVDWLDIKAAITEKKKPRDTQSTEILFLEQCHRFLVEGGYLAIVIPDGILTNSSLQYVRDNIEEIYRIVAVISMPQTAFSATGAGVKSSVLFLRKHKGKTTEKIAGQKEKIKDQLKKQNKFIETVETWEKEKNVAIKQLEERAKKKYPVAGKKEINEIIQADKSVIQSAYSEKINKLKDDLEEKYFEAKQHVLDDYQIFMAIAEDIGYDATGRLTNNNELIEIGKELARFIAHINNTES